MEWMAQKEIKRGRDEENLWKKKGCDAIWRRSTPR